MDPAQRSGPISLALQPDDRSFRELITTLEQEGISSTLLKCLEFLYELSSNAPREQLESHENCLSTKQVNSMQAQLTELNERLQRLNAFIVGKNDAKLSKLETDAMAINDSNTYYIEVPNFIYSYKGSSSELYWTELRTGKANTKVLAPFRFRSGSSWCAFPNDSIYFTGGHPCSNEVVSIEIPTFKVSPEPPMIGVRFCHSSVYHKGYLYVIGGHNGSIPLKYCERYSTFTDKWESIASLEIGVYYFGLIRNRQSQCLYALGGHLIKSTTNAIQEYNLVSLTWRTLSLMLPSPHSDRLASFKLSEDDDDIYFLQDLELYKLNPSSSQITAVKSVSGYVQSVLGPCYYSNGKIYCSFNFGPVKVFDLGTFS